MAAVNDGQVFDAPYNVVAGFRSRQQAESAARRLTSSGLSGASVEVGARPRAGGPAETAELRAEMQEELSSNWAAATGRQTRGALLGTTTLAFIGLIVGLVGGFLANVALGLDMSLAGTMTIGGIAGLVGFSTIGFVAGGGMAPRVDGGGSPALDDAAPAAERHVLLAVHLTEPAMAEKAAEILRAEEAERVDLVDASGTPLPPQHGNPRPGDPGDYWWKAAGEG